ncbi:unnamed protein product [Macrosiphum euphorbiae]|uniref:Uncharacterized protein n=1 Tax=Macrosiphum euphorbiae TaxID=13131 RepID=A0AAV0XSS8_9HEMI|nr:unnamed protein product [Macrosiphum euphorbiae]
MTVNHRPATVVYSEKIKIKDRLTRTKFGKSTIDHGYWFFVDAVFGVDFERSGAVGKHYLLNDADHCHRPDG